MDEIISSLAQKLGLPETTIRNSVATMVQFLGQKVKGTEYEKYFDHIPGARAMADAATETGEVKSGGLGGLLGSMLGGQAGDAAAVISKLQAAGLPSDKLLPFVKAFIEEAKKIAGADQVDALLAKFPMIQGILKD